MGGLTLAVTGWAGAELVVDTYDGDGTWRFNDRLSGAASAYEVAADIAAWLVSDVFADPEAQSVAVEQHVLVGGRLGLQLVADVEFAFQGWLANSTLRAMMGWAAGELPLDGHRAVPDTAPSSPAAAAFADASALTWSRHDKSPGGVSGAGAAWSNGATRYAARRPSLTLDLEPAAAAHLELSLRSTPQLSPWLHVYDPHTAAWRRLTYGAVTVEGASDLHAVSLEALGGPSA